MIKGLSVYIRRYYILAAIVIFILSIAFLFVFFTPEDIVRLIGIKNSYLVVFLLAAIGGLSTLTSASFITAIATFSLGGAHPLLLGLSGGIGIFISDSIFFIIAEYGLNYGKKVIPGKWQEKANKFALWSRKFSLWKVMLVLFLCMSLIPIPNDILMIALVLAHYTYRNVALVLLAGGIAFATLVAYLAQTGIFWF